VSLRQNDSFKARSQLRVNSEKQQQRIEIADITEEQSIESNEMLSPLHVPKSDSEHTGSKDVAKICSFHKRKTGFVNCTNDLDTNLNQSQCSPMEISSQEVDHSSTSHEVRP